MNNNKYTIDEAVKRIADDVQGKTDVIVKIFVGNADEYYSNGNYEAYDDKFVWYQINGREKVIGKFITYEEADNFAKEIMQKVEYMKQAACKNISKVMLI